MTGIPICPGLCKYCLKGLEGHTVLNSGNCLLVKASNIITSSMDMVGVNQGQTCIDFIDLYVGSGHKQSVREPIMVEHII